VGVFAFAVGAASLCGWALDVPQVTRWTGGDISMQPNASLATAACGAAILVLRFGPRGLAALLGALVACLGAATLVEHVAGMDLGIDRVFLFDRKWGSLSTVTPGRMGPPAATSFVLLGAAFAAAASGRASASPSRLRRASPFLAIVVALIMLFSLTGYLLGASPLYTTPWLSAIALQTSVVLFAVAAGLVAVQTGLEPMRTLTDPGGGGTLARRTLPAIVLLPPLLGLLRTMGEDAGMFGPGTGRALLIVSLTILLLAILWSAVVDIARRDATRRRAEARLADELTNSRLLQGVSASLAGAEDPDAFHARVLDAARGIMRAQCASIQALRNAGEPSLELLSHRGFAAEAAAHWARVTAGSESTCGAALRDAARVVIPDVDADDRLRGTKDLESFRLCGIRSVQTTPLLSRSGELLGMISTHWSEPHEPSERDLRNFDILARLTADVLERRVAEQRLRDADRRKDEFLATLAHELRNPLAPVMSSLEILRRSAGDPVTLETARDTMQRQMSQLVRLVDDLLDMSRITSNKLALRKEPVTLARVLREAVEASLPSVDAAGHRLLVSVPPAPVPLHADATRLTQVFANLLNNAAKFTDPGGEISLSAERSGDEVTVTVRDDGIGMAPDRVDTVFDMFTQIDGRADRPQSGLGIGLTLVKRLVEMHGGSVTAQSEGLGRGSAFTVRLPVAETPAGAAAEPPPPAAPPRPAARHVLIVDDNQDAALTLAALLRLGGDRTRVVHDGADALRAAEADTPDVILLDIGLPKMDGYAVCRAIRAAPWGTRPLVVAVTGWGQDKDRALSKEAGFDAHLVKPVDHRALLDLLVSFGR
jgi:signal transduction histidine kinase/CheY-like chemotaxis protein